MLTLVPTQEQQQIVDAVRSLLHTEWPIQRLREWAAREDLGRWSTLVHLGALGIGIAAEQGGLGLTVVEEALVFREFGRALLPPGVLGTVLGAHVAAAAGDHALCERLVAGGQTVGVLNALGACALGEQVQGPFHALDAAACGMLLGWSRAGAVLLERRHLGPTDPRACVDDSLELESAVLQDAPARSWLPSGREPIFLRADVLVAALLVGVAEAARDMAVDYARLREAFGQPIGAFQAIKHRCADAAVRAEAAWCQTLAAAIGLRDADPESATDVAAARWLAAEAAQRNAENSVQVHGGIGFSAEALPHRFVKRAVVYAGLGAVGRNLRGDLLEYPATSQEIT